jgi:hypothetical protein
VQGRALLTLLFQKARFPGIVISLQEKHCLPRIRIASKPLLLLQLSLCQPSDEETLQDPKTALLATRKTWLNFVQSPSHSISTLRIYSFARLQDFAGLTGVIYD